MNYQVIIKKRNKTNPIISIVSLCFIMLFSCDNFGQELDSKSDLGMFHFEEEVIDYGTIAQNDNGVRTFKFTNKGHSPIVISKVKTTCGCTVPTYPKQAILPGETGTIDIKYATNRIGTFSKSITVISNAENAQKKLRIKGNVTAKTKLAVN